jgi:hypothetical protein
MAINKINKSNETPITGYCQEHGEPKQNGVCEVCRLQALVDIYNGNAVAAEGR